MGVQRVKDSSQAARERRCWRGGRLRVVRGGSLER